MLVGSLPTKWAVSRSLLIPAFKADFWPSGKGKLSHIYCSIDAYRYILQTFQMYVFVINPTIYFEPFVFCLCLQGGAHSQKSISRPRLQNHLDRLPARSARSLGGGL
jgi:hypothetical protein